MSGTNNNSGSFEQEMANALNGVEQQAAPYVWDNIEAALQPQRGRVLAWWFTGAAASVLGILLAANWLFSVQHNHEPLANTNLDTNMLQEENCVEFEFESVDEAVAFFDHAKVRSSELGADPSGIASADELDSMSSSIGQTKNDELSVPDAGESLANVQSNPWVNPKGQAKNEREEQVIEQIIPVETKNALTYLPISTPALSSKWAHVNRLEHSNFQALDVVIVPEDVEWQDDVQNSRHWALAGNLGSATASESTYGMGGNRFGFAAQEMNALSDFSTPGTEVSIDHRAPVQLGAQAAWGFSKRLSLISGLQYTGFRGVYTLSGNTNEQWQVNQHFLGVPVLLGVKWVNQPKFQFYSNQGIQIDKGIAANSKRIGQYTSQVVTEPGMKAPGQMGSIRLSMGGAYRIRGPLWLYSEATIATYIMQQNVLANAATAHPLWPSMSLGLRYQFE